MRPRATGDLRAFALEVLTMTIGNPLQRPTGNVWQAFSVANGSGAAGATVTVAVAAQDGVLPPSAQYFVDYDLPADYTVFTTNKTAGGFTVNIQPRLAANSVAAGTFNLQVSW
jgi:hypothetical protein